MPALLGMFRRDAAGAEARSVVQMLESVRHRSTDASGELMCPNLGVMAAWLAPQGSFASRVSSYRHPDGSAVLFCGECYLTSGGARGSSMPEPESFAANLIEGCREEGRRYIARLNGLFSALLIDQTLGRVLLFNDRYGIERLYVYSSAAGALFSSEAKALLRVCPDVRELDLDGVAQYLAFGSVRDNRTLFKGVQLLPGGSVWEANVDKNCSSKRYFAVEEWEELPQLSDVEYRESLTEAMARLLPAYLAGEQLVGIAITGGLDTRMIMASLPAGIRHAVCYTFAGMQGDTLDSRLAGKVADACGLEHYVLRIASDFLSDFAAQVDRTVYVTDGCAGPLQAHEIYLNQLASQVARVRLTGNYGSEVLRGMSTLKPLHLNPAVLAPEMRSRVEGAVRAATDTNPVTRAAFAEIPWHLFGTFASARSELTVRTPYLDNEIVRLAYRAPLKSRRTTSAACHLISVRNRILGSIPTDRGLVPNGEATFASVWGRLQSTLAFKLDYWHKEGLPPVPGASGLLDGLARKGYLGKHKYLPYRLWFKNELSGYVRDVLASPRTRSLPYFDPNGMDRAIQDHRAGRTNALREIHAFLTLEAVERLLVRGHPAPVFGPGTNRVMH